MAHLIEQMAYVGATPWHGLGNQLSPKQPLEVWQQEAGMNWQIQESPVRFMADSIGNLGTIHSFPEHKVLYRSDSKEALSVVSKRYQVVQPREVLEFYRDLATHHLRFHRSDHQDSAALGQHQVAITNSSEKYME